MTRPGQPRPRAGLRETGLYSGARDARICRGYRAWPGSACRRPRRWGLDAAGAGYGVTTGARCSIVDNTGLAPAPDTGRVQPGHGSVNRWTPTVGTNAMPAPTWFGRRPRTGS